MLGTKKKRWALAVAGLVLLAGAAWGARKLLRQDAETAVAREARELRECLLGGPLEEGELPSQRLRRIELAVAGDPAQDWPARCAQAAQRVELALESSWLGSYADDVSALRGVTQFPLEVGWDANARARLDASIAAVPWHRLPGSEPRVDPPGAPPRSPAPLEPLPLGREILARDHARDSGVTDPVGRRALRLLLQNPGATEICALESNEARCQALSTSLLVPLTTRLSDAEDGATPLVRAESTEGGARRPGWFSITSARPVRVEPTLYDEPPAYVDGRGRVAFVRPIANAPAAGFVLRMGVSGGALSDHRLKLDDLGPKQGDPVELLSNAVWWAHAEGAAAGELWQVPFDLTADSVGEPERLGEVPAGSSMLGACATATTRLVLWGHSERAAPVLGMSPKVHAPLPLGQRARLACFDGTSKVAAVRMGADAVTVIAWHCASTCTAHEASVRIPGKPESVVALPTKEGIVLAHTTAGVRGLFVREAPLDELETTASRPLFDDAAHGGLDVEAVDGFVRGSRLALLASSSDRVVGAVRQGDSGWASIRRVAPADP